MKIIVVNAEASIFTFEDSTSSSRWMDEVVDNLKQLVL